MQHKWSREDMPGVVQHGDEGRCPVLADDGAQCFLEYDDHIEHDFRPPNDADTATKTMKDYAPYITMVSAVRGVLSGISTDSSLSGARATGSALADIARIVGFRPVTAKLDNGQDIEVWGGEFGA